MLKLIGTQEPPGRLLTIQVMGSPEVFNGLMVTGVPDTVTTHWLKLGPFCAQLSGLVTLSTTVTLLAVTEPVALQTIIVMGMLVPFSR